MESGGEDMNKTREVRSINNLITHDNVSMSNYYSGGPYLNSPLSLGVTLGTTTRWSIFGRAFLPHPSPHSYERKVGGNKSSLENLFPQTR